MKKKQLDDAVNKARVEYAKKWPNAPAPIMDETGRMHVTGPSKADYEKLVALENMQWFADRAFNKTLSLPDDEGNFLQGIGSVRDELLTAGISGLVNTAVLGDALRRQKKGEDLSASDQALIDASGILQATTDMYGKAFKRGQGFGESVAWMEGFVLSGGAAKAGEATAMKVLSKATQDRLKKTFMGKVATNVLKGAGSAVARTPLLVGGYDTAIERATGAPMLTEDGTWKVDPASIEPAWKAVAKGVGTNFTEAFGEMGGGFFAGSGIAKKIAQKVGLDGVVIPKWVRKYAETTALQPLGELPEEYFTTLMQTPILGDQSLKEAFSKENNIETAIQVGIMTGVMGFPAVVGITAETAQRSRDKGLIDIFGRENITAIRDGIMTNNMMMVNSALNSAMSGKTAEDLKGKSAETAIRQLYNYAYSIAKERGATVAQEEIGSQQVKTTTGTLTTQVGPLKVPEAVSEQVKSEQKAPFVEINSQNISEIQNNTLTSLKERNAPPEEIADVQHNLDIIKQSVDELILTRD